MSYHSAKKMPGMDLDFGVSKCKQLQKGCIKTKSQCIIQGTYPIFYNIHNGKEYEKNI